MRMVEAGTLDLDRDVSAWLGWRLRNPAFPDVPVTLRLLLSHRASLADGVDYAVPLGKRLEDALADPRAWDAGHPPGSYFRYANIGFPVIAGVMERAGGERFDRLMRRLVFEPLALDACFNWSGCSPAKAAQAVVLYRANGDVARDDLHGIAPRMPGGRRGGLRSRGLSPRREWRAVQPPRGACGSRCAIWRRSAGCCCGAGTPS
ncbi:MAG: serine hydrolase domain-containing protein [Sphingomonas sp.]